jgi:alpha-1,2-mannosyltransferase
MGLFPWLLTFVLPVVLASVFFPTTLRFLGGLVGHYLIRASQTRRELLLSRAANEQKIYDAGHKEKKEDEDWEEIEGSLVGSAVNGGKADTDWHGIVGFFHPFWYVLKRFGYTFGLYRKWRFTIVLL